MKEANKAVCHIFYWKNHCYQQVSIQRQGRLLASTYLADKPRKRTGYNSDKIRKSTQTHSNTSSLEDPGERGLNFLQFSLLPLSTTPFDHLAQVHRHMAGTCLAVSFWQKNAVSRKHVKKKTMCNPVVTRSLIDNVGYELPYRVFNRSHFSAFFSGTHSSVWKHLAQGRKVQSSLSIASATDQ